MSRPQTDQDNPFRDRQMLDEPARSLAQSTLNASQRVSLTLGNESLTIVDQNPTDSGSLLACCGLLSSNTLPTRTIPYFHILWAEITPAPSSSSLQLVIDYAHTTSHKTGAVSLRTLSYILPAKTIASGSASASAQSWVDTLLDHAYLNNRAKRQKKLKLLVNPFGGQGRALRIYHSQVAPILRAAKCQVDFEETRYSGHAIEIARTLDADAYDAVACVSGDGLPHEIFNGFGKRTDAQRVLKKVPVSLIPGGSGNSLSWSCFGTGSPSLAAVCVVKGVNMALDLASITYEDKDTQLGSSVNRLLSFCSQSVGMVAEVDLGTENLRWLGDARFTVGFLQRVLGKTVWPADVALIVEDEDKTSIKQKYVDFSSNHGKRPRNDANTSLLVTDTASSTDQSLPELRYGDILGPLNSSFTPLTTMPNLGNFYAGNMTWMSADAPFFAAAQPSDGCLDLITVPGNLGRLSAVKTLLAIDAPDGGVFHRAEVTYRKVKGYRIVPHGKSGWMQRGGGEGSRIEEEYISIDGERLPFGPFQCEVHEGLGTVLSRSGWKFEAPAWGEEM